MQPLNILFVTPQYPPAVGGTEQLTAEWAHELVRRGHRVHVFTTRSMHQPTWAGALPTRDDDRGVQVLRFRTVQRGPRTLRLMGKSYTGYARTGARRHEAAIWLTEGPLVPGMFIELYRHAHRYDVIVALSASTLTSLMAAHAARRAKTPFVNVPLLHLDQMPARMLAQQQWIVKQSDALLPLTSIEAGVLQRQFGADGRKIQIVPPIVVAPPALHDGMAARAALGLPARAFVTLFLARKVYYKGYEDVVLAHQQCAHAGASVALITAGPDTEFSSALKQRVGEVPQWLDLGTVSEEMKWQAFAACDVFAMPSGGESFGIVYGEAWIAGKPVIGAQSGAVGSVIADGDDGWLVPLHNPAAIADRIMSLASNPHLARRMGELGRAKALSCLNPQHVGDIHEGVYYRLARQASFG